MNYSPKILLVYPGYIVREQPLNILYIASVIKDLGLEVELFHLTSYRKRPLLLDKNRIIRHKFMERVKSFRPDIVAFSTMTVNFFITKAMCHWIKAHNREILTLVGGIHPTVDPNGTICSPNIDMICIGEGDEAIRDLLSKMMAGEEYIETKNFWFKQEYEILLDGIVRNDLRPLISNLDSLPFPDRECLDYKYMHAELYGANIITSRGCPYPCAYCQNKYLMDMCKDKGSFVRHRSLENIFNEIAFLIEGYNIKRLSFTDEVFTLNKQFLFGFCEEYRKQFKLPFLCQTRPDLVNREVLTALKEAGCDFINMAIESGNDHVRKNILNRKIDREKILESFRVCRELGIRTGSFNIIGIPGENLSDIWDTINLNKEVDADRIFCTIFMPFKGTELGAEIPKESIICNIEDAEIYYSTVTIVHPEISPRTLLSYQGFFDYFVRLDQKYYKLIHLFRYLYKLLPPTHNVNGIIKRIREFFIELVYDLKKYLPHPSGFFISKM